MNSEIKNWVSEDVKPRYTKLRLTFVFLELREKLQSGIIASECGFITQRLLKD